MKETTQHEGAETIHSTTIHYKVNLTRAATLTTIPKRAAQVQHARATRNSHLPATCNPTHQHVVKQGIPRPKHRLLLPRRDAPACRHKRGQPAKLKCAKDDAVGLKVSRVAHVAGANRDPLVEGPYSVSLAPGIDALITGGVVLCTSAVGVVGDLMVVPVCAGGSV